MSQLDISISFSNIVQVLLCSYVFLFYIYSFLIQYRYNKILRVKVKAEQLRNVVKSNVVLVVRRVLNL